MAESLPPNSVYFLTASNVSLSTDLGFRLLLLLLLFFLFILCQFVAFLAEKHSCVINALLAMAKGPKTQRYSARHETSVF